MALLVAMIVWHGAGRRALVQTGAAMAQTTGGQGTVIRYLQTHGSVSPAELAHALGWMAQEGLHLEAVGYSQGGLASSHGVHPDRGLVLDP